MTAPAPTLTEEQIDALAVLLLDAHRRRTRKAGAA